MHNLFIKNMVCDRCRSTVEALLHKRGIAHSRVQLGEADLANEPDAATTALLRKDLSDARFELIEDKSSRVISKVKSTVIDLVRNSHRSKRLKLRHVVTSDTEGGPAKKLVAVPGIQTWGQQPPGAALLARRLRLEKRLT